MANNIPLGGPFFNSTTYSNSYNPEKKSQSTEKIKSKDNLVTLSDKFKMYTETSYAKNYQ